SVATTSAMLTATAADERNRRRMLRTPYRRSPFTWLPSSRPSERLGDGQTAGSERGRQGRQESAHRRRPERERGRNGVHRESREVGDSDELVPGSLEGSHQGKREREPDDATHQRDERPLAEEQERD